MTITICTSCYSHLIMDTIDPEFTIAALGSFLCHKLPYAFEQLSLYSIKLYIYGITTPMSLELSICVLLISFMQSVNGAQFSNITPLLFSSCRVAVSICTSILPSGGPES